MLDCRFRLMLWCIVLYIASCVLPADYEVDFITFFDRLTSLGAKVNADQYLIDQLVDAPRL